MKEVSVYDLKLNPMAMIGSQWWLVAAGNEVSGYNAMTASWGHLGAIWERSDGKAHLGLPTAVVYLRPKRYTKEFMNLEDYFTLSVFDDTYRKALAYMGTHSGREEDKIAKAGFNVNFIDGMPYFNQAEMIFICRKLYHAPLKEEGFVDKSLVENNYVNKDFHEMYVGEIMRVMVKGD